MTTFEEQKSIDMNKVHARKQCQEEEGHVDFGNGFIWGMIITCIVWCWILGITMIWWNRWGVDQDYAYYDIKSGKLIWRDKVK